MALRSSAEATTWAHPGGVRSTTRLPEAAISTTHSPSTRRRCSLGHDLLGRQLGQGVGAVAAGQPDLDRAELLEVPGHRRLGGLDPLVGQQVDQLGLVGDRPGLEDAS